MNRKKETGLAGIVALACTAGLLIVLYVAFVFPNQAINRWGGAANGPPVVVRLLLDADNFCKRTGLIWLSILVLSTGVVSGAIQAVRKTANKTNA